jgi:FixJ family two-component response regulator
MKEAGDDGKRTVVIIDDYAPMREALGNLLSVDYAIKMFASAEEFLSAGTTPDCLILDFGLPGMNGLKLQQYLLARCPVIFISGSIDDRGHLRRSALEGGAIGFLRKPFDATELVELVRKAVAGS